MCAGPCACTHPPLLISALPQSSATNTRARVCCSRGSCGRPQRATAGASSAFGDDLKQRAKSPYMATNTARTVLQLRVSCRTHSLCSIYAIYAVSVRNSSACHVCVCLCLWIVHRQNNAITDIICLPIQQQQNTT